MVMMHVVVAGAGGIGGAIAGEIALAGGEVSVVDGWSDHVEAIRADGLRLMGPSPAEERTALLPAWQTSESQQVAPIDVLVLAAKAFDNQWLAPLLAPQLATAATVISAQNGVNEPLLAEILLFPAEITGPGQVRLDWRPTLQIGELDGTHTDRLDQMSSALCPGIDVAVSDNIWGAIWSKLVMNCMSNPVNAALGGRARDCREQPGPQKRWRLVRLRATASSRWVGSTPSAFLLAVPVDPGPPNWPLIGRPPRPSWGRSKGRCPRTSSGVTRPRSTHSAGSSAGRGRGWGFPPRPTMRCSRWFRRSRLAPDRRAPTIWTSFSASWASVPASGEAASQRRPGGPLGRRRWRRRVRRSRRPQRPPRLGTDRRWPGSLPCRRGR